MGNEQQKKPHKWLSIKALTAIYSATAIIILTTVLVILGYNLYEKHVKETYTKYSDTVLNYAYSITEEYAFGDMIAAREMPEEYEQMREKLNKVKENSDIDYLYAVYFDDINDTGSLTYAINAKTEKEIKSGGSYTYLGTICEEGSFEEGTKDILQQAIREGKTDSGFTEGYSEGYGHMFNSYRVIYDSEGNPVGILCVEIDVKDINGELNRYVKSIIVFAVIFTAVIAFIYVSLVERHIINPITQITDGSKDFIRNIGDQESIDKSVEEYKHIDIHSQNEIGELYDTVGKMESEMADQYRDIRHYSENALKMQNGLIVLMADMVENRDSDTGDHIQKTASYVQIIMEGLRRNGYYTDTLTPEYMDYVIRSAPLHDVGKIRIPDAVLNKPGKLTKEEFDIMKTHSAIGEEIIDKAINTVEGGSYLKEARNMAAFHHERWDGKGYPEGLQGEDIPLSARIMAVADVFDALTSKRVYKPAFPLQEALNIIEEGKGTQFDPKCVEVFMAALPKIKAVLRRYNPDYLE